MNPGGFYDEGALRQTAINLNGRGVPLDILQQWGWPVLPIGGDGNIQLRASGSVQANAPLKPTVNAQLHAVNMSKQEVTQTMSNGEVSTAPPVVPAPTEAAPVSPPAQ